MSQPIMAKSRLAGVAQGNNIGPAWGVKEASSAIPGGYRRHLPLSADSYQRPSNLKQGTRKEQMQNAANSGPSPPVSTVPRRYLQNCRTQSYLGGLDAPDAKQGCSSHSLPWTRRLPEVGSRFCHRLPRLVRPTECTYRNSCDPWPTAATEANSTS